MAYYVPFKIHGRKHLIALSEIFEQHGIDADYYPDNSYDTIPYLKFEEEEDATVFILIFGGTLHICPP